MVIAKQLTYIVRGLSEVRWTNIGQMAADGHMVIHSGGQHHVRGAGVILDKNYAQSLKGFWALSDRAINSS